MIQVITKVKSHVLLGVLIGISLLSFALFSNMATSHAANTHTFGAAPGEVPACGTPLAMAGYSVTATTSFGSAATIGTTQLHAEFSPLGNEASLDQATGMGKMYLVHDQTLSSGSWQTAVQHLNSLAGVSYAAPIWLQSSDPQYFSCDYKLKGNAKAQLLARKARSQLIVHGVSAALLDDPSTMLFVAVRQFGGKLLLQVAFVNLPPQLQPAPLKGSAAAIAPVTTPKTPQAFVALLDPSSLSVVTVAKANWFN